MRLLNLQHIITSHLLRANCTGMDGEGIKGVIEDARLEDLSHFESCIERIYQLGGSLPKDATQFIKMSGCEFLQLPPKPNRSNCNSRKMSQSRARCDSKLG